MFSVKVFMSDGKVHEFETEKASDALDYASRVYPGFIRLIAKSDACYMEFGKLRLPTALTPKLPN